MISFQAAILEKNNLKKNFLSVKKIYLRESLKDNNIIIKNIYSSICGTQINEIFRKKGKDNYLPHLLGHEAYGQVLKVGKKVKNVKKGDYVIVSWITKDSKNFSFHNKYFTGDNNIINSGAVSTFQQYSIVPKNKVYKTNLKKNVLLPLLGCSIPTGYGMVKKLNNKIKNKNCGIMGCGSIGFVILLALIKYHKLNISILERKKIKIPKSSILKNKKINFYQTFKQFEKALLKTEIFFDTTGNINILSNLIKVMNNSSVVCFASNHNTNKKLYIDPFEFIKGKQIFGTWGGNLNMSREFKKLETFFKFYKKNCIKTYIKTYSLSNINQAIADYKKGKVLKAIIKF